MKKLKIGVIGLGCVGSSFVLMLEERRQEIAKKFGLDIHITRLVNRSDKPELSHLAAVEQSMQSLWTDDSLDCVVELIGGTLEARQVIENSLNAGKHCVSANKMLLSQGEDLLHLAQQKNKALLFEAAVCGSIPIVRSLEQSLVGENIKKISGLMNGTSNYILTQMTADASLSFADCLKQAQTLGYAESDPTLDINGMDAMHKLIILARLSFGSPLNQENISYRGIDVIIPEDIEFATEFGYAIKHLAVAERVDKGISRRVDLALVPHKSFLASIDGSTNAVAIQCSAAGNISYSGAGAGGQETASAVLSDVIAIGRGMYAPRASVTGCVSMNNKDSSYFLSLTTENKAGVLEDITGQLGLLNINVQQIRQKIHADNFKAYIAIIISSISYKTLEKLKQAMEQDKDIIRFLSIEIEQI